MNANRIEVVATGTIFNVTAYQDDETHSATLVEGKVNVKIAGKEPVMIGPGQRAEATPNCETLDIYDANIANEISWVEGLYRFDNMPLSELAARIERWYDVNINLKDQELGKIKFTGAMEREKPVELILTLIKESKSIHYSINGKNITLYTK